MIAIDHLLTLREVAALLGVSTKTVYEKLIATGELPYVRVLSNGNAIRVRPEDLLTFVEHRYGARWPPRAAAGKGVAP